MVRIIDKKTNTTLMQTIYHFYCFFHVYFIAEFTESFGHKATAAVKFAF